MQITPFPGAELRVESSSPGRVGDFLDLPGVPFVVDFTLEYILDFGLINDQVRSLPLVGESLIRTVVLGVDVDGGGVTAEFVA